MCKKDSIRARANFFMMFTATSVMMWLLKDYGYHGLKKVGEMQDCENKDCTGTGIVLRMSFAMVVLHTFLSFLVCGIDSTENPRSMIQNMFFPVKWLMLAGTVVASMYLPNVNTIQFGYVASVFGALFLIMQAVLVLEFAYGWNDAWVEKYDSTGIKDWAYLILGSAFVLYALSITVWVLLLIHYGGSGCDFTNTMVSLTIVISAIITIVALPDQVENGAILPTGVIVFQCTSILASAILSVPMEDACAAHHTSGVSAGSETLMRCVGILLTIFSVAYMTMRSAESGSEIGVGTGTSEPMMEAGGKSDGDNNDESEVVAYNYSFFHIVYAIGAMYLAMVLVDWKPSFNTHGEAIETMSPWITVWIKIVSQWITFGLYMWTLIAPFVCSSREWG